MTRDALNDLAGFVAVAAERSFTRAAAKLGVSPSALSHAQRGLEDRLGVRLLTRTTRSVAVTEAGERLLHVLRPALADIEAGLAAIRGTPDRPAGTVRVTAVKHAVTSILAPMLPAFTARYPDIRIEVDIEDSFSDIVTEGYDAGIRFGGSVAKDMIAVRVGSEIRFAVVAAPGYLAGRGYPRTPKDLADHRCIAHGRADGWGNYPWPFLEGGRPYSLRIEGALVFNDSDLVLDAAVAGHGIACVFEDYAAPHLAAGRLTSLLPGWLTTLPGYELYYPSRRHNTPALSAFVASLRDAASRRLGAQAAAGVSARSPSNARRASPEPSDAS